MIIRIALLGFGASGTAWRCRVAGGALPGRFRRLRGAFRSLVDCHVALALRLPFNPLAIVWERGSSARLGPAISPDPPFLFGASALGLTFTRLPTRSGASTPATSSAPGSARWASSASVRADAGGNTPLDRRAWIGGGGACPTGMARRAARRVSARSGLQPRSSRCGSTARMDRSPAAHVRVQGAPMALSAPDARIVDERSSPLGLIDVVESPTIPFRHAPGLSLNNLMEPPEQRGVFTDGHSITAITRFDGGDPAPLGYLDPPPRRSRTASYAGRELILGAGAGEQVLLAILHGRRRPWMRSSWNPQIVDVAAGGLSPTSPAASYDRPDGRGPHRRGARAVRRTSERYDLIQIPLLYSFGAAAAGTQSLHENYTYTVEAITRLPRRAAAAGVLSITRWLQAPAPRQRQAVRHRCRGAAAHGRGRARPARLAMIRSWNTATLLVKNGAVRRPETSRPSAASRRRAPSTSLGRRGLRAARPTASTSSASPYLYEAATRAARAEPRRF